jgi:hypothetical protein
VTTTDTRPGRAFQSTADLDVAAFAAICESDVDPTIVPRPRSIILACYPHLVAWPL